MKKKSFIMTICLLLTTNVLFASSDNRLSKNDSIILFGKNSSKVVALEEAEMIKTEGKYWDYSQYNNITNLVYSMRIGDTTAVNQVSINISNYTVIAPVLIIAPNITNYW